MWGSPSKYVGGVENTNYNGESNNKSGGKTSPRMHRKRQNGYELSKSFMPFNLFVYPEVSWLCLW